MPDLSGENGAGLFRMDESRHSEKADNPKEVSIWSNALYAK
jgi:hypothetical protein